jgi:hypothetical protein
MENNPNNIWNIKTLQGIYGYNLEYKTPELIK